MAKEFSRTFDTHLGAAILVIRDEFGHDAYHTIHLISDDIDLNAESARLCAEADERTAKLRARMEKNGWSGHASQP